MSKILDNYKKFASVANEVKNNDSDALYLGGDAESDVWKVEFDDGEYVVKLARKYSIRGRPRNTYRATARKIETYQRGLGVMGLQQVCAGSPEAGVVVCEYVPGDGTDEILASEQQKDGLFRTIEQATSRGIEFDGWNSSGDNVIFNTVDGFTLIDYKLTPAARTFEANRVFALRSLGPAGVALAAERGIVLNLANNR